jgi:hypothetical protein
MSETAKKEILPPASLKNAKERKGRQVSEDSEGG